MRRAAQLALTATLLAVAALVITSGPERSAVTAEFTDVRGLVTGAQVRLAGVPVGDVTRIWLAADGWPRVQMSIDHDVALRASASAAVRLASLSGEYNRYVSIVQGAGPPLSGLITQSHTTSPVEVDDAISTFDPATRTQLGTMLAGLKDTLSGQGPALAATLRQSQSALSQVGALAADVGGDGGALRLALASTHTITQALARRSTDLTAATDQSAQLMGVLAQRADGISAGVAGLPPGLTAAQTTLTRAHGLIAPADRLLNAVAPALAQLPATATEWKAALGAARPTLTKAATLAVTAPAAARALTPLLKTARPLLGTLIPALTRIGPMLDQLRVRLPDAFSFFANWADFTSNYDANGHGARVGIVLPPAPTTTLAPSSNGAGQLAPPYLRIPGSLEGQPWTDYSKSFVAGGRR
jgi:phospholipid/cholesterol/gamma-HCH transport system substrate-binding protein